MAHFLSPVRRTGLDTISAIAECATTEARPNEQIWVPSRRQLSFGTYLRSKHVNSARSAVGSGRVGVGEHRRMPTEALTDARFEARRVTGQGQISRNTTTLLPSWCRS